MKKINFHPLFTSLLIFLAFSFLSSCRPGIEDDVVVGQSKEEFDATDQAIIGEAIDDAIHDASNGFEVLEESDYSEMYIHLNAMIRQLSNTAIVQRRSDFDWKISVLNDDVNVNSFIAPGGHLYMTTGMLKFLEGEHELVGVIAHEIAYADSDVLIGKIKEEVGSKNLSKILSHDNGEMGIALDIAQSLQGLKFEEIEIENSDNFSTEIVCEFSWDGEGLMNLLKRAGGAAPIEWLENKPVNEYRFKQLAASIYNRIEPCGIPDSIFYQRYFDKVVNQLP